MKIAFTKDTLANGLDVLVHEDHRLPIVGVNLWYHVGSKNECQGRTGFAHLFEHLMFEGSEHYDEGFFQPLQKIGAAINGSTNADRTNYWEVVPSTGLELALWMESDRMGFLLPALTTEKFLNQRDVVLNERRQNYENRPYGLATMAMMSALHPPEHPYHWPTIGFSSDIADAQIEDATSFFETYYHPGNASLALAGDIDTDAALELVDRYFAEIPGGTIPIPIVEVVQDLGVEVDTRLLHEDRVELPRLYLAWRTPAVFTDGDAELDLLAELLAYGKNSRLYRSLVHERRIATDVTAVQSSNELSSVFQIVATAAPGHNLSAIEKIISDELKRFIQDGPERSDLERGHSQIQASFLSRLQTVGRFGGKSDQLNTYNVFLGDPGYFSKDFTRYTDVTSDRVRQVAASFLDIQRRVAVSVVPHGQTSLSLPDSVKVSVS